MDLFSVRCPKCRYIVRFHDATLLGRKGRCPKCRHKFILNERDVTVPASRDVRRQPAERAKLPVSKDKTTTQPTAKPPSAAPAPAPAIQEPSWETDISRTLPLGRQYSSRRWVFPDPMAPTTVAIIGGGAAIAAGAAMQFAPTASELMLALSPTLGGALAACCLIRLRAR